MDSRTDAHEHPADDRPLQKVQLVLAHAERKLGRAVQAAAAGELSQLLDELVGLACLVHISSQLAAAAKERSGRGEGQRDTHVRNQDDDR
ncbi:MAG: hypothetical protein C4290_05670 [Chloroflexota bacterium]